MTGHPDTPDVPPTRWSLAEPGTHGYSSRFAELVAQGEDVDGEARLADALTQRGATILDAGAGMGRVTAGLRARGHTVTGIEPDRSLVAQAEATYPGLGLLPLDILETTPEVLEAHGRPTAYALVVAVGNVFILLAEGTEQRALRTLRDLLAPGGRMLIGFHLSAGPAGSRTYAPEEFVADATAAGLTVDLRAGSYELHPANEEYAVWLLSRDDSPS
ncbi:class I SAM-dependent methyltransferase [Knoellia subterranea]|uniref:SAM-dependent methyltransferase n=1 Tax=Knoellia subterranea KCTC 19937 TaxID=1385521 RepID=A0A0A0JMF8_9MICO|nr:class I SAM-dependent methyltransferase [Knoellia subterranea]KGN38585.1 SAM-dependent methyltransferase [Knoellia subterranea KCTC 19937]